jgi:SAM-dependent methyltransferase
MDTEYCVGSIEAYKKKDSAQKSWRSYWNQPSTYEEVHRAQAVHYVDKLTAISPLDSKARVLDFGAGFGFVAEALVGKVGRMYLWDISESMRNQARRLLARYQNVEFLDLSGVHASVPVRSCDLIIVNSVVQYMTVEELASWLVRWRAMLSPKGRIVLSDLVPSDPPPLFFELFEALAFSARCGMFLHVISPRQIRALKRYWKTRKETGPLLRIGEDTLRRLAGNAGLAVQILPGNLTHFSRRMTALLFVPPLAYQQ